MNSPHYQDIAHRGACGKSRVLPHNRLLEAAPWGATGTKRSSEGREPMACYVINLQEIDRTQVAAVGGKGAHLGELSRVEDVHVPAGFCVTTDAFQRMLSEEPSIQDRLDSLSRLRPDDLEGIRALSADLRGSIEAIAIPDDVADAIRSALTRKGVEGAYAVRSSATAEDLPTTSFAGQQDTYLNVAGSASILRHVSRCWASLFTERAVAYRLRNGIDDRKVQMAVVVQRMVMPQAAGILFTADPASGNRKVSSVEASFGLGEALVSGLVNADNYKVRDSKIVAKTIATKRLAIYASPGGGTQQHAIDPARGQQPALADAQVVRLAQLGRRIEAHFGAPQDIEWCLADDEFHIVQSRPITTLFPIPAAGDRENRVYVSVGHQQMMTDAMKPLGISLWQLTALGTMYDAGGRLFVDVTQALASPASRIGLMNMLGRSEALIGDALQQILERGDFLRPLEEIVPSEAAGKSPASGADTPIETDPAIVTALIARSEASIATVEREIRNKSGLALLDFILADIQELQRILFDPQSHRVIMAGIEASWWLNEQLQTWLGEKNAADALTQSVPHNVTSEMGLALLDVADVIRPSPDLVTVLQRAVDDKFLDQLAEVEGGQEARDAIVAFLQKYGARCAGEIDITRPRWSEGPVALVPLILGNIRNFEAGASKRRFSQGLLEASKKEQDLLRRLRRLPDGERKAEEAKRMIDRLRTFIGYREYPKYSMVRRYFIYKLALLEEAERLVEAHILADKEDIFYLTFQEFRELVRTQQGNDEVIRQRKDVFRHHETLTAPRVLTSDGEMIAGTYRRDDLPDGALVGLAVSGGIVEGRARVVLDMAQADLEAGDILVTTYTDPSWTPLFVSIQGLVTEVGGLMTHGVVIAREYGLPAVVGVEHATRLIRDGQRIRVNGTDGYVEILP